MTAPTAERVSLFASARVIVELKMYSHSRVFVATFCVAFLLHGVASTTMLLPENTDGSSVGNLLDQQMLLDKEKFGRGNATVEPVTMSVKATPRNITANSTSVEPAAQSLNSNVKQLSMVMEPYTLGMTFNKSSIGLRVLSVDAQSDAFNAGFRVGDEILEMSNTTLASASMEDVYNLIRRGSEAKALGIKFMRDNSVKSVTMDVIQGWSTFGVTFAPLAGQENKCKGENMSRIIVSNIVNGSPADKIGLKPGDVVVAINNIPTILK